MKKLFLGIYCLMLMSISTYAQFGDLNDRISKEKNFYTVIKMATLYYDSIDQGLRTKHPLDMKRKHWERYKLRTSTLLNPDGTIAPYASMIQSADQYVTSTMQQSQRATNASWSFVGPSGHVASPTTTQYIGKGRVDRICFHPSNANVIMVGTPDGGIWKTIDGGATWYCVNENLPAMGIAGIEYCAGNPNIVYALTGCGDGSGFSQSAGVLKSLDGGETWQLTNTVDSETFSGYNIAVHPTNANVCYIATTIGLYKTNNSGLTWKRVKSTMTFDVKFKPTSPSTVYSVDINSFTRWFDDGTTVTNTSTFAMPSGRKGIGVSAANSSIVYILSGPMTSPTSFTGIWRSINSGLGFTLQATTPNVFGGEGGGGDDQSGYDFAIAVNPANASTIFTAGLIVWKSINDGLNWTNATTYGANSSSPSYVHPDIHDVKYNPLNGFVYIANDGGFYKSTDDGATWSNITNNINTTQIYNLDVYSGNHLNVAIGCQDNGTKAKTTETGLMDHVAGGDGFCPSYGANNASTFISSTNFSLDKYTNNGTTQTNISPKSSWFIETACHVSDGNIVFAGTDQFHISNNLGSSWTNYNYPANRAIATCPSLSTRLYIVGNNGGDMIHRVDNLGGAFTRIDTNPGLTSTVDATDIDVHPVLADFVYVTYGGFDRGNKVFFSDNAGLTWSNISFNLPNIPILCIQVTNNNDVFIGTDIGVFYKDNLGSEWRPFSNQLPKVRVYDLVYNQASNYLYAGTHGRGIWRAIAGNGTCIADVNVLPSVIKGYHFYEASNSITALSDVVGSYGTNVYFKAQNYIDLIDGFEIKDEGTLGKFYLGNCGESLPSSNGQWNPSLYESQSSVLVSGSANDFYGNSLAKDGDLGLIGVNGKTSYKGAVSFIKYDGSQWNEITYISNSAGAGGDQFGYQVCISGNKAAISAINRDYSSLTNVGDVDIYTFNGSTWAFEYKIQHPVPMDNALFGYSLAMQGDYVVVGVPLQMIGSNVHQGAVYIFKRSGTTWPLYATLSLPSGEAYDKFGTSVHIKGHYIAVGATGNDIGGKVFLYEIGSTSIVPLGSIVAADITSGANFGVKVDFDGDYIAVGATDQDGGKGAIYLFKYNGNNWIEHFKVDNNASPVFEQIGFRIDLSSNTLLVGSPTIDGNSGIVYEYKRNGNLWNKNRTYKSNDIDINDRFGSTVLIDNDQVMIGASFKAVGANVQQGKVYFFKRE